MTRRGIIAALIATTAEGQNRAGDVGRTVMFQRGPVVDNLVGTVPEPKYALEVWYGDRVVLLTAAEIMNALEDK
jgi:hypothetical protein